MIAHGRTRPVSLCLGAIGRKSDCERLRKIYHGDYKECKLFADRLHRTRKDTTRLFGCLSDWPKVRLLETHNKSAQNVFIPRS